MASRKKTRTKTRTKKISKTPRLQHVDRAEFTQAINGLATKLDQLSTPWFMIQATGKNPQGKILTSGFADVWWRRVPPVLKFAEDVLLDSIAIIFHGAPFAMTAIKIAEELLPQVGPVFCVHSLGRFLKAQEPIAVTVGGLHPSHMGGPDPIVNVQMGQMLGVER